MEKIKAYLKDVHHELINKTSWPTWSELQNSAIVVMIASVIIAAVVYLMDFSFDHLLQWIYEQFY
ncbi:preprotein translocase subunit SecE [Thermophagus sp. OGC60D27]|uniref:preprotein translocase subunit SecE n=1 Tax=Thermophagus sp. OGC60D27 TaxID=3458415 RepID=UPI004037C9DB